MKTIALVAASDFNGNDFKKRGASGAFDQVVAIDAGFAHLQGIGRTPDVALGDFDSLGYVPTCGTLLQFPAHKDKSDMELALEYVAGEDVSAFVGEAAKTGSFANARAGAPRCEDAAAQDKKPTSNYTAEETPASPGGPRNDGSCPTLYIYGALGGRIDHTLANIQLIARYAEQGMAVTLVDRDCVLRFLVGPGAYALPPIQRGVVSVFALTPAAEGVTETGMEYPLDDATLTNRTTLGLSNELIGKPVEIRVRKGTLLVIHPT